MILPGNLDEDILEGDGGTKVGQQAPDAQRRKPLNTFQEQKRSLIGVIHGIQDTVLEIQGYVDELASTLERVKKYETAMHFQIDS